MKKPAIVITLVSAVSALILAETSWPQALPTRNSSLGNVYQRGAEFSGSVDAPAASAASEISRLVNELRGTEDAGKKAELTKQLEAAIAKQFERDMESRRDELRKLEERLNKLRTQLDRRNAAKTDIIQLELKVLVNEAEGLGFSSKSSSNLYSTPNNLYSTQQEYNNKLNVITDPANPSTTPAAPTIPSAAPPKGR